MNGLLSTKWNWTKRNQNIWSLTLLMTGNSTQGCQLKSITFSKTRDQIARCLDNRWSKGVQKHLKTCQKLLCKNVNFKKTQSIPGANKWLIYVLYIRSMLEQWTMSCSVVLLTNSRWRKKAWKSTKGCLKIDTGWWLQRLITSIQTLSERRTQLCLKFAKKSVKNGSLKDLFQPNTDSHHEKFHITFAKTDRLKNYAIPFMQRLLNTK